MEGGRRGRLRGPERRGARTTDLAWLVAAAAPGTSGGGGGGERDLRLRKAACGGELLCVLRVCCVSEP